MFHKKDDANNNKISMIEDKASDVDNNNIVSSSVRQDGSIFYYKNSFKLPKEFENSIRRPLRV